MEMPFEPPPARSRSGTARRRFRHRRPRAGLAEQADPHRRAVHARRLVGHHRARDQASLWPRR